MDAKIDNEQRLNIIKGAKLIAEALKIPKEEVYQALQTEGYITSDEEFILRISMEN